MLTYWIFSEIWGLHKYIKIRKHTRKKETICSKSNIIRADCVVYVKRITHVKRKRMNFRKWDVCVDSKYKQNEKHDEKMLQEK